MWHREEGSVAQLHREELVVWHREEGSVAQGGG